MKLLPPDTGRRVRFKLSAKLGNQVFVAGTFNRWNPAANPLTDSLGSGNFKTVMCLPAGEHEYKFVVNGIWSVDPKCTGQVPNSYGSQNSKLHVPCFKNDLMVWGGGSGGQVSAPCLEERLPFQKQEGRIIKNKHLKHLEIFRQSTRRDLIASGGIGLVFLILFMLVLMGRI